MIWLREKLKGWKTVLVNLAFMVVPILDMTEFAALVPAEYMKYYIFAMVIANLSLRKMTTTAIGKGE